MTYLCGSGFFFFNDTATTEIYTLSLHDALPIYGHQPGGDEDDVPPGAQLGGLAELEPVVVLVEHRRHRAPQQTERSEEHTSELQSRQYLVCRLLLEKKKKYRYLYDSPTIQFARR